MVQSKLSGSGKLLLYCYRSPIFLNESYDIFGEIEIRMIMDGLYPQGNFGFESLGFAQLSLKAATPAFQFLLVFYTVMSYHLFVTPKLATSCLFQDDLSNS